MIINKFFFKYYFEKEGKNIIKIISSTLLKNIDYMFYQCSSLTFDFEITLFIKKIMNKYFFFIFFGFYYVFH